MCQSFIVLFQGDIDEIVGVWNHHKIRPMRYGGTPHGRPEILYNCPENYGTRDYLCHVSEDDIDATKIVCSFPGLSTDADVADMVEILTEADDWSKPSSAEEAVDLYLHLRRIFHTWIKCSILFDVDQFQQNLTWWIIKPRT